MLMMRTALLAAALLCSLSASAAQLLEVPAGSTDVSVTIRIIDDTTGAPETGVVFDTATLDIEYCRDFAACVDVGLNALTTPALTDAHEDGAFLHKGFGEYRLDLPDAAVAAGVKQVSIQGGGVSGMIVIGGSVTLTNLPTAAPGASGGLPILGANGGNVSYSGTHTYTGNVSYADGITITRSTSNQPGWSVTGNGTGHGMSVTSGSGATGNALNLAAASTNGHGLNAAGAGTGSGVIGTGGATGDGIEGIGGATSGAGGRFAGTAGNSPGVTNVGQGSAAGQLNTGGATGEGLRNVGGATSGPGQANVGSAGNSAGVTNTGQGSAAGQLNTGGATGPGSSHVGGGTSGPGMSATSTSGNGITATAGGGNGSGIAASGNGSGGGLTATAGATGHGINGIGGATSGNGVRAAGTAGNSAAMNLVGQGSAAGLLSTGGATGEGARLVGGATSGAGLTAVASAGNGDGVFFVGQGTGNGAQFTSGSGATGSGAQFTAVSTNGNGIGTTSTGSGAGLSATPSAGFVNPILLGQGIPAPTTIATYTSNTSFTIAVGSADDNAYNGYGIVIRDASTAAQTALGCVRDYAGASKTVTLLEDPGIFTFATPDNVSLLPAYCDAQVIADLLETALLICTVDTANFAGDANDFACDLTDRAGAAVTSNISDNDFSGLEVVVLTGAQQYEKRFVSATTDWDDVNNEMRLNVTRNFPATLADGVTVIIR